MQNDHVKKACEIMGSQAALARALKVSSPTITEWANGDRPVPIIQCVAIERITEGRVTRKDLRPDDWQEIWPELVVSNHRHISERRANRRKPRITP